MSSQDNSNSNTNTTNPNDMARQQRRGSVSSAALSNLFRSNSISQGQSGVSAFPGPLTTAALNDQRRRLSITTLGLSGTSPNSASTSFMRRASMSTNSDSIDESAIDEDDVARTAPATPFTRRMSFGANQAMRTGVRGGGTSPGNESSGFNWSDQLRSRAESVVSAGGPRASFSFGSGLASSPPRSNVVGAGAGPPPPAHTTHDRAKSVSDMPAPPAQAPRSRPQKPDPFQERILKGDFYMD